MKTLAKIYPDKIEYLVGDEYRRCVVMGKPESIEIVNRKFYITIYDEEQNRASIWADEIQKGDSK